MPFNQLNLSEPLVQAIAKQGYDAPTPVQAQTIPLILQGKDILAGAQTGTGKTASFALPILHILHHQPLQKGPRPIKALVLTPTRELAIQVHKSFMTYGQYVPLFSDVVYGGVKIQAQIRRLSKGVDILIATPGRLLDLMNQKKVNLSQLDFLVLDEADRMMDMGFINDICKIIAALPHQRQNLLFSATYSKEIKTLASQILNNPIEVSIAKENATADKISQSVYAIKKEYKRELISWLIGDGRWQQVLIFVRTKHGADRLCKQLMKDGIRCSALHGDKSQGARNRALEGFKSGKVTVLVATDVAARGLDISQLPHVVNFDLPAVAEDYIHRIGRTGRAGAEGDAISLVAPEEAHLLGAIEKLLNNKIPRVADTGYESVSLITESQPKKTAKPRASTNNRKKPSTKGKYSAKKPQRNRGNASKVNQREHKRTK